MIYIIWCTVCARCTDVTVYNTHNQQYNVHFQPNYVRLCAVCTPCTLLSIVWGWWDYHVHTETRLRVLPVGCFRWTRGWTTGLSLEKNTILKKLTKSLLSNASKQIRIHLAVFLFKTCCRRKSLNRYVYCVHNAYIYANVNAIISYHISRSFI